MNAGGQHFSTFLTMHSAQEETNPIIRAIFVLHVTMDSLNFFIEHRSFSTLVIPLLHIYWFSHSEEKSNRKTLWKKVKLLKMSNFTFFHNVFYPICISNSFNSHISDVICSFFEFGMVLKWCIREWIKIIFWSHWLVSNIKNGWLTVHVKYAVTVWLV